MTDDGKPQVGFMGLGAMGAPMASHVAGAGWLKAVWNRTTSTADALASEAGCVSSASPAELAEIVDIIVICVSRDEDVEKVIAQMIPGLRGAQLVIDCSTVSPMTAKNIAGQLAEHNTGFVDAPVSGGVEGAKKGTLAVMAGGSETDFQRARPVLDCFAAAIHHLGEVGNGQATKAVNQVMVAGIAEAVCEALALAERLDLPLDKVLEVTGSGAASSWFLDQRGASMLTSDFSGGFKQSLLLKDLGIVLDLAESRNFPVPTTRAAYQDYTDLVKQGHGDEEISGLIRLKRSSADGR